ncbi:hypothetical protein [Nocardia brasiliensis]|uniref:hypothetical protein n=1 Tax=Nocardia brasiliensis TaxID=37326 RepID=UPI002453E5AA|nr:hypothetical protein [Nocardia brasiliensis]
MPSLETGSVVTTADGQLAVVVTLTDDGKSVCRPVESGQLVGDAFAVETATLTQAFLPADQARSVYAARAGIDVKNVPATPIGTAEYAEYHQRIRTELRKSREAILAVADPKSREYRMAEEFLSKYPPKV